jgi:hypothetical protein
MPERGRERERESERAEVPDDGRRKRRTTDDGEILDLYGQRDFREREVFVRNSFEFPSV